MFLITNSFIYKGDFGRISTKNYQFNRYYYIFNVNSEI